MANKPCHFCKKNKSSLPNCSQYIKSMVFPINLESQFIILSHPADTLQHHCVHKTGTGHFKGYPKGLRSSLQLLLILFCAQIGHKHPEESNIFLQRGKNRYILYILYKLKPLAKLWATLSQGHSKLSERQSTQEKSA